MATTPNNAAPRGRPRLTDPKRRDESVGVRMRRDERHRMEQLAAQANHRSLSDYLREVGLTGKIIVKRFKRVDPMLLNQLSRIGNNLNQIARICNQTGELRKEETLKVLLAELRPALQRLHEL